MAQPSLAARLPRMARDVVGLAGTGKATLLAVPVVAFAAGLTEALVLVLLARLGVAVSQEADVVAFPLGPLGDHTLSTGATVGVALLLASVGLGLALLGAYLGSVVARRTMHNARIGVLGAFLAAAWGVQAREREGRLQEVLTTYVHQTAVGVNAFVTFVGALLSLTAVIVVALATNPVGAAAIFSATALLSVVLRPLQRATRRRALVARERNAEFATTVSGAVGLAQEVRTFGVTDRVRRRLADSSKLGSDTFGSLMFMNRAVPGIYQSLAIIILIVALAVVTALTASDMAAVGAVVLLLLRSVAYGRQLYTAANLAQSAWPYLEGVQAEQHRFADAVEASGDHPLAAIDTLAFEAVSYSYDGAGSDEDSEAAGAARTVEAAATADGAARTAALADVEAVIGRGETIGIIGPSGSGKSTFVQVLLRLRPPTRGRYLVNGVEARELSMADWFRRVGVVPQQPRTVEGTVADNIRFFRDDISDAEVEAAARAAHLHDEIMAWPRGYDTELGGTATGISGGQLQRLCLARALAQQPALLVLDEPTSALDGRSEALVHQTLADLHGGVTVVVIAHRLSTLRMCDRLLVFDEGRLVDAGPPGELAGRSRYYRDALALARPD